jgi:hypothetical protein
VRIVGESVEKLRKSLKQGKAVFAFLGPILPTKIANSLVRQPSYIKIVRLLYSMGINFTSRVGGLDSWRIECI